MNINDRPETAVLIKEIQFAYAVMGTKPLPVEIEE